MLIEILNKYLLTMLVHDSICLLGDKSEGTDYHELASRRREARQLEGSSGTEILDVVSVG
jgi:hypothetical protein